jgi:hypothetical protein
MPNHLEEVNLYEKNGIILFFYNKNTQILHELV